MPKDWVVHNSKSYTDVVMRKNTSHLNATGVQFFILQIEQTLRFQKANTNSQTPDIEVKLTGMFFKK